MKKRTADALIESAARHSASEELTQLRTELKDARSAQRRAEVRLAAIRGFRKPVKKAKAAKHITRVVVPDSHGSHIDETARDVFLRDLRSIAPQEILMLGDHLDCGGTFSTHQRSYTNEITESYSDDVAAANAFLDLIQDAAPNARIYYLEGNHEAHVERWAARNFNRRRDAILVLDRIGPHAVLELVRRDIEYFRASEFHMGLSVRGAIKLGKLYATHGISHGRHATVVHMDRFGGPVVHGHTHRAVTAYSKTVTSELTGGFCPGTLAKLQPLYRHTSPTEWTHGYGLQFASESSGRFVHLNIPIIGNTSLLPELTGALGGKR